METSSKYLLNWVFSGLPVADHYSNTSLAAGVQVFPLLYYNHLSSSSPGTVFMDEAILYLLQSFFSILLEGFLYGNPELCALTCTLAKKKKSNYSPV